MEPTRVINQPKGAKGLRSSADKMRALIKQNLSYLPPKLVISMVAYPCDGHLSGPYSC